MGECHRPNIEAEVFLRRQSRSELLSSIKPLTLELSVMFS